MSESTPPAEPASEQTKVDHQARVAREKALRDAALVPPSAWPHDAGGRPMAITIGMASDLVNTGDFSNLTIGPAGLWRPVAIPEAREDGSDLDVLAMEGRLTQLMAQYMVGIERRLLTYRNDPSSKIEVPSSAEIAGLPFSEFAKLRMGS